MKIHEEMKKLKKIYSEMTVDDIFYCIGIILFLIQLIVAILIWSDVAMPTSYLPDCQFKAHFGISCLGCGMTRAFQALYRGQLLQSLKFNPLALYFAVLYAIYMIMNTIAIIRNIPIKNKARKSLLYPHIGLRFHVSFVYIGLAIALIFGITRGVLEILNGQLIINY